MRWRLAFTVSRGARRPAAQADQATASRFLPLWLFSSSLTYVEEFHVEEQHGVGWDHATRAAGAVAHVGGNGQCALSANFHTRDAFIPPANHLARAELER